MDLNLEDSLKYSIFDPVGNITALVESRTDIEKQPVVAEEIMAMHPEVEQVGFVRLDAEMPFDAELRMAGGEFCGNAAMSAAALYYIRKTQKKSSSRIPSNVRLKVSGSSSPVDISLEALSDKRLKAGILMPEPLKTEKRLFSFLDMKEELPLVTLEGISHIIIEPDSAFFLLMENHSDAESAVRSWCRGLSGLGLMFLEEAGDQYQLTPLVYVPLSNTVFWEMSCASGTAAAGMYLFNSKKNSITDCLKFKEPGGILQVRADSGRIRLISTTELVKSF